MPLNRFSKWLAAALLLLSTSAQAQVSIPNTFSPNTTAQSALVNANFSQLGQQALNRAGGIITGNISVDPGVTIDGIDIGAVLGGSGTPTFSTVTATTRISVTGLSATSLLVSGGVTVGSGNVAIIGTDGRIPAFTTTYFANLDGSTITGIAEANITDGTLLARLSSDDTITGTWTFTHAAPQITLNNGTSNWITWSNNGAAAPAFTTRSAGTKVLLHSDISGAATDFALGIESGAMWFSVPTTSNSYKFYGATTNVATLTGFGDWTQSGALTQTGIISPSALTSGNNANYAPTGFANATLIFVSGDAIGSTLTGIAAGSNGRLITICNAGGGSSITLSDEDANSLAANRIRTISTILGPGGGATARCADLVYIGGSTNRWFVKSRT